MAVFDKMVSYRKNKSLDNENVRQVQGQEVHLKKRKSMPKSIVDGPSVSVRWMQSWPRSTVASRWGISYLADMGRPKNGLPGRREPWATLSAFSKECSGSVSMEKKDR